MLKDFPAALRAIIDSYPIELVTAGWSEDTVYRLHGAETCYLKTGVDLRVEHDCLRWLEGRLPAPRVLHYEVVDGLQYLLMTAVPGVMMHEVGLPYRRRVQLMAEGARMWHALPVDECPFDWRLDAHLARAQYNVTNDLIDRDDFDPVKRGCSAQSVLDQVRRARPASEDLVVVHGDYCLPNILVDPLTEQLTGFVDVGRMGVADRFVDLALASRSIAFNLGADWIMPFMADYGIPMDRAKYDFFTRLDEFF
jgi:aminoglycoside phosphotransferase